MSDQAEVNRKTAQSNREESAKIQHMINLGWGAALVSTGITAFAALLGSAGGVAFLDLDSTVFLDIALILALAYGVYRKSRVCAVVLFLFFVTSKLTMLLFAGTTALSVIPSLVIWGYFYLQGVRGTFAYHRRVKQPGFVWIQPAGRNGGKTEHFLSRTLAEASQPKEGKENGRTDRQEGANRRE
ncbi:hypothetical protein [Brevibacillus massiliensis]|uniref:hypothetical protein n=1 Tax=Brevibacillus massiliensis TaxID=1118054 RepID=UPI0002DC50E7|nr:hypothetical protein [Brevibacillus massiliensis]